jgi:hypothetical protein
MSSVTYIGVTKRKDFLRRFSHRKRLEGISWASAVLRKAFTALPEQPKSLALSTEKPRKLRELPKGDRWMLFTMFTSI